MSFFNDVQLYHGPVAVLPMMQAARGAVWQSGGIVSGALTVASDAERRQRRLEMYRQRHAANMRSYDIWTSAMADDQRQQTALLFQRWLDSRCKRTAFSKSKIPKGEVITADPSSKSTILVSSIRSEFSLQQYHRSKVQQSNQLKRNNTKYHE